MATTFRKYVLDTNVLIAAFNTYYNHDTCPGFWDFLGHQFHRRQVVVVDRVFGEIEVGTPLAQLIRTLHDFKFASTASQNIAVHLREILDWVADCAQYTEETQREFEQAADCWIVAFAKATNAIVVTNEKFNDQTPRVKIPNVCRQFGIECIETFEFVRRLGMVLVWAESVP